MKTKIAIAIVLASILGGFLGCRLAPIGNVENAAVRMKKTDYTLEDVRKAITRAGLLTGWQMEPLGPGTLLATYVQPDYAASVTISYSRTSYSIRYRNSRNLDYKAGRIHENYNVWVQSLDEAIRSELGT